MYSKPSWTSNKFQWVITSRVGGNAYDLQSSYFARDDRIYKAFVEKVERRKSEIESRCSRRLRWQLTVLRDFLDGRTLTFRVSLLYSFVLIFHLSNSAIQRKVELLTEQLDNGDC